MTKITIDISADYIENNEDNKKLLNDLKINNLEFINKNFIGNCYEIEISGSRDDLIKYLIINHYQFFSDIEECHPELF